MGLQKLGVRGLAWCLRGLGALGGFLWRSRTRSTPRQARTPPSSRDRDWRQAARGAGKRGSQSQGQQVLRCFSARCVLL